MKRIIYFMAITTTQNLTHNIKCHCTVSNLASSNEQERKKNEKKRITERMSNIGYQFSIAFAYSIRSEYSALFYP